MTVIKELNPTPNKLAAMPEIWDVVTLNLDNTPDRARWESVAGVRGVIVEICDQLAKVIWSHGCGLTLHWHLDLLKVAISSQYTRDHFSSAPLEAEGEAKIARTCRKCGYEYMPEPVGERGICCKCIRDEHCEAVFGTNWRQKISGWQRNSALVAQARELAAKWVRADSIWARLVLDNLPGQADACVTITEIEAQLKELLKDTPSPVAEQTQGEPPAYESGTFDPSINHAPSPASSSNHAAYVDFQNQLKADWESADAKPEGDAFEIWYRQCDIDPDSTYELLYAAWQAAEQHARADKFKTYVHQRLDDAAIPTHPNGPHSKEGCRVGDRLDILIKRMNDAIAAHADLSARIVGVRDELDKHAFRLEGYTDRFNAGRQDAYRQGVSLIDAALAESMSELDPHNHPDDGGPQ